MKKMFFVLLVMGGLAILLWQLRYSDSNTKSPPSAGYSRTIEESKRNGFYEFDVVANKPYWKPDSGLSFEITNAWVENCWSNQAYVFGKTLQKKLDSSHQLILNIHITRADKPVTNQLNYFVGNKILDTFIHYHCDRTDTIWVPLFKTPFLRLPSRKERKAFDSISFVRRGINY